jgi:type IV pilus assembly protein PilM
MAQRIVGLDIGTSAIRAVELTVGDGSRPILEAFGQVGLNPGTVVDGEIRDQTRVVEALQRLWHEGGFSERRVNVGVAGLRAITREVDMPPLPPDELDDAVKFQADQVIPFPLERTAMSAKVIAQYNDADGAPQIRVLVAAAHRDLIDSVVSTVQAAGLQPVGMDLDTAALARALYDPSFSGGPEAIVSVGAGLTMVVVHQGGLLQFVRTIDLGGESISKAIASALDIPLPDAEEVKRKLGEPGLHDSRAESAVSGAVDELVGEIHNSIRFFSSLPGRGAPSRILVTGAGARTAGFLPKLQQGIDTPVQPASPLSLVDTSRLPISPEQAAAINPTMAVPVGLALPDPGGKPFNLLPDEIAAKFAEKHARNVLAISIAVVVVLLAALTVWRVLAVHDKENQVATLTSQQNFINNVEIPKYDKQVALKTKVVAQQAALRPLVATETNWLIVLNQLAQYQTTPAVLASLTLTESAAAPAAGAAPAAAAPAAGASPLPSAIIATANGSVTVSTLPQVTQWGLTMSQSPAFVNVSLGGSTLSPGNTLSFSGTWEINGNAHSQRLSLFTKPVP